MNKRLKNKLAKQQQVKDQAVATGTLAARVMSDVDAVVVVAKQRLNHVIEEVKSEVTHRLEDVKAEMMTSALELEKRAEHMLEKVPVIGESAARALHDATEQATHANQATA